MEKERWREREENEGTEMEYEQKVRDGERDNEVQEG